MVESMPLHDQGPVWVGSKPPDKTAGKDALAEKPTYVSLLDLDKARAFARKLHLAAIAEIKDEDHASFLLAIADRVVERSN